MSSSAPPTDTVHNDLQQVMRLHQGGRLDEADQLYAKVLSDNPDHVQALRLRGILARERGDMTTSFDCLNQAVENTPDDPDPLCEMALSHMAIGDLPMAEGALRAALDLDATSGKALANLGALLQYRGHDGEAITLHQRALAQDPDDVEVRCNLARALADVGEVEQALAECDKATEVSFGYPLPLAIKGSILSDTGRYDEALEILAQAVRRDPGNDMALVNLAFAHLMQQNPAQAEKALRQAIMINPSNARATSDLINVLWRQERFKDALQLSESFLEHHPGERMVLASYAYALRDAGDDTAAQHIFDYEQMVIVSDLSVPEGYTDQSAFHTALAEIVHSHPSLIQNPASKSTYGGGQTGELDFASDPALAAFEGMIKAAIQNNARLLHERALSEQTRMSHPPDFWSLRAWGTVLEEGGHQTPHIHPLGWMSGVYYVSLPDGMSAEDPHAGWLEFGFPPERYHLAREPLTSYVEPKVGRLVTFPSYMYHRTEPFTSDQPRISIAFDVMPAQSVGVF